MGDSRARGGPAPRLASFSDELRSAFLLRDFSYAAACGALSEEPLACPRAAELARAAHSFPVDDPFGASESSDSGADASSPLSMYGKEPIFAAWPSPRLVRGSPAEFGPAEAAIAPEPGPGDGGGGDGPPLPPCLDEGPGLGAGRLPRIAGVRGGNVSPGHPSSDAESAASGSAVSPQAPSSPVDSEPSLSESVDFDWPDSACDVHRSQWGRPCGGGSAARAGGARFGAAAPGVPPRGGFAFEDAKRARYDADSSACSSSVSPQSSSSSSPVRPPGEPRASPCAFPCGGAAALLASPSPRCVYRDAPLDPAIALPAPSTAPTRPWTPASVASSPGRRPETSWSLRSSPARSPVPPPRPPRPASVLSSVTRRKLPPGAYAYLASMPLAALAAENQLALLAKVLRSCPPLDLVDRNGRTALHHSAALGRQVACEMLAWAGADLEARDVSGQIPEQAARCGGHFELADALGGLRAAQKEWNVRTAHVDSR